MRNLTITIILTLLATIVYAGSIDQPTAPTAGGRMYTLDQIYQKVHTGTNATKHPDGSFTEPLVGTAPTMETLDQVYNDFKTDTDTCNAVAANVLSGKTFFAATGTTRLTDWGPVAGTMPNLTLSNLTVAVPAGYYGAGTALNVVDTNLAGGNIKSGVSIFGVPGSLSAGGGLPRTGQTTTYVTYDDGYYQKGSPTAPAAQYTSTDGGLTTTDNGTGLIWAADGNGAGCNNGATATWSAAITYCNGLTFASSGPGTWRLPNIKELVSIVDYSRSGPAINVAFFPNTKSSYYWSSTTYAGSTDFAWRVDFSSGFVSGTNKTAVSKYVRAVRGGQGGLH